MSRAAIPAVRVAAAALLLVFGPGPARGFLGIADTSFVTVIANPAEAANWAAELERLNNQLLAARQTLQTVGDLRAYAGDPRAAVAALGDLGDVADAVRALSSGAQTDADLARAWQALGAAQRAAAAAALLRDSGPGETMQVFGDDRPRDTALYARYASDADTAQKARGQISQEQLARVSVAAELALAWVRFRGARTESGKQAVLAEISQLQSQSQVMDARRRALLDDLELSDRQARTAAAVQSRAADEQLLAESSLLNASVGGRSRDAQAQRMATLQKTPVAASAPDYSGVRMWTTADAGGPPN
jgi:hypothetical protein